MLTTKSAKIVALVMAVVVVAAGYSVYSSPRAFAQISVQVNPEIVLTLDRNHTVLKAEFKGAEKFPALSELTLVGLKSGEALANITASLTALNLLQTGREVTIVVVPAHGVTTEQVAPLAAAAEQVVRDKLKNLPAQVPVAAAFVGTELYEAFNRRAIPLASFSRFFRDGLTEAHLNTLVALQTELKLDAAAYAKEFRSIVKSFMDLREVSGNDQTALALLREAIAADPSLKEVYHVASAIADMKEVGITTSDAKALLALRPKIEPALFLREVDSLASALIDMFEVGIKPEVGLATITAAIAADPSLKELDTVTSALSDLVESGTPIEEAVVALRAAMQSDPTLRNLDRYLGLQGGSSRDDRDRAKDKDDNKQDKRADDRDDDKQDDSDEKEDQDDDNDGQGKKNRGQGKKQGN